MTLTTLDHILIFGFFGIALLIGVLVSRRSGKSTSEYFLSGKTMPWWLLGISMVATTFSTDTPNLVTNLVRVDGVAGNWAWWAFLITGLLTVFVYAKLWRKSNVNTDIEFYEIRYGGRPARFLRGFRSIYLGIIFNVFAMAGVTLAAIKIGGIMLGLEPWQTVVSAGLVTVVFSAIGGFKGVIYTDFLLFFVAMVGSIAAAYYCVNLDEVGGVAGLIANSNVMDKISILPDVNNKEVLISVLIIPLAVQWWSTWYPGAEPGGGGYIAQRMLAAKNENHAIGATFFFNILHYALRPWPWIIVALASLIIYPDLASLQQAFPNIPADKIGHDLAYSAMLTKLPAGLLGLVLASLVAAYMSTISTHLNWGSSYIVNDFYKQTIEKNASEKRLVAVGRWSTVLLMVLSALLALVLQDAMQIFKFIIMFGSGTGLMFILRWFWWRINAWSEISAMFSSGIISIILSISSVNNFLFHHTNELTGAMVEGVFPAYFKIPLVVITTTAIWLTVTLLTKAEDKVVLFSFYRKIQAGGIGWSKIIKDAQAEGVRLSDGKPWSVPSGILAMISALIMIYSALFATGYWIYGDHAWATGFTASAVLFGFLLSKQWRKIGADIL